MKWCPKCDTRLTTKTVVGAPYDQVKGYQPTMSKMAQTVVGWYSQNWTARAKECPRCGYKVWTTEVPIDDVVEMLKQAGDGSFVKSLKHKTNQPAFKEENSAD